MKLSTSLNRLAAWSVGLGIGSWAALIVCALIVFGSGTSIEGQYRLGLVMAMLLLVSLAGALAAIITGHWAKGQLRHSNETGRTQIKIGLTMGYLFLPVFLVTAPIVGFVLIYTLCSPQSVGSCS